MVQRCATLAIEHIGVELLIRIEELSDFPSLQQLSRSLWRQHAERRGAALLVGAGFSRNATLAAGDTPKPPSWVNLHAKLAELLYPTRPADAPSDTLRLAEEFRAYFGQAALDEFIRSNISDDSWYPSGTHVRLLELPWSDVLTTNWDTLLERASRKVTSHSYEFVRASSDLVHARAPRIVKLHGTVGRSGGYVFAEEDYRTYPERYAAFVNFARQVFIENELCLIGFSGDDPNFLQWSGWVRDHLASSSRRIYLVGVLRLSPAKRKLLESRNVAPIDLAPLVDSLPEGERHAAATEALLGYLENSQPAPVHAWMPTLETGRPVSEADFLRERNDPGFAATLLTEQARKWKAERESYPGWLVCPHVARQRIRWGLGDAFQRLHTAGDSLSGQGREKVLFEIAWRVDIAMLTLPQVLVTALACLVADIENTTLAREQQLLLVRVLLYTAREQDDGMAFARWSEVMTLLAGVDPEARAELAYQRCLRLRDRMNFTALDESVPSIDGPDPIWKLRKAFLLAELRRWSDVKTLLLDALNELRDRESDARDSLWLRSRRTWAQWLASAAGMSLLKASPGGESLSSDFSREAQSKCDPWAERESFASEVRETHRKYVAEEAERFVPMFEPGTYRHDGDTVRFVSAATTPPGYILRRFMECVGIPLTIDHVSFLPFAADAIGLEPKSTTPWYLGLISYADKEKEQLVVRFLGRTSIATLPSDLVRDLISIVLNAIGYWRKRAHDAVSFQDRVPAIEALVQHVSMLYRLTPRMDHGAAAQCFRLGLELGADSVLLHHWLTEPVSKLLRHSARAMPVSARTTEALPAIEFPLPFELNEDFPLAHTWPDPLHDLFFEPVRLSRTGHEARWSERVGALLRLAKPPGRAREHAVPRLATLATANVLLPDELATFGEALWAQTDGSQVSLPVGTGLLPHMFAILPAPIDIDSIGRVRARLFDNVAIIVSNEEKLNELFYAAAYTPQPLLPTSAQATVLFDAIIDHYKQAPIEERQWPFGTNPNDLRNAAGRTLGVSIMPALDADSRTEERAHQVLNLVSAGQVWTAITALPYLVACSEAFSRLAVERISEGIMGVTYEEVASSAWAIEGWQSLYEKGQNPAVPMRLLEATVAALEARRDTGLTQVVRCCRKLVINSIKGAAVLRRIARAVVSITTEYEYVKVDPMERRAVSVSMVRAECALLAKALLTHLDEPVLRSWLEQAKVDPLPEVRLVVADAFQLPSVAPATAD